MARQAPLLLIRGRRNARTLPHTSIHLPLFSNPLKIVRPLTMRGTRAPAINPIGIAPLVDEETLPGEVNHLFGDRTAQFLVSPAGGEVGKTDVLLWARAQKLMAISESCFACPVCCHALPVNNAYLRHGISQLCQHMPFCRDRDRLWPGTHHQQCRCRRCRISRRVARSI